MTERRLVEQLKPLTGDILNTFTIGQVNLFESITKVDFDFFWRKLMPVTPKLDPVTGNEVTDAQGNVIMVPDREMLDNPQPIPNKTRCLAVVIWLINREEVENLTVEQIENEVSYREMWGLLNQAAGGVDVDDELAKLGVVLEDDSPLAKAPTTGGTGTESGYANDAA